MHAPRALLSASPSVRRLTTCLKPLAPRGPPSARQRRAAEQGFKADMAGVAEARKRADDKHRTERLLDEQMRDKMRRQADEQAQEAQELVAAHNVQAQRDAALKAREAAAADAARALSEQIRQYNECAACAGAWCLVLGGGAPQCSCAAPLPVRAVRHAAAPQLRVPCRMLRSTIAACMQRLCAQPRIPVGGTCPKWGCCGTEECNGWHARVQGVAPASRSGEQGARCREKIEADRKRTAEEREADATWMRGVLARESEQVQQEKALRERQRLELQRWLHALETASHAEELVCRPLPIVLPLSMLALHAWTGRTLTSVHARRV